MRSASDLPLSIIFLGIGKSSTDFKKFSDFNSESPFNTKDRANVSFLAHREISKMSSFSHALLHKIPEQCLEYMELHQITPRQIDGSPEIREMVHDLMGKYDVLFGDSSEILRAIASAKGEEPNKIKRDVKVLFPSRGGTPILEAPPVKRKVRSSSMSLGIHNLESLPNYGRRMSSAMPNITVSNGNNESRIPIITGVGAGKDTKSTYLQIPDFSSDSFVGDAEAAVPTDASLKITAVLDAIITSIGNGKNDSLEIKESLRSLSQSMSRIEERLRRIEAQNK